MNDAAITYRLENIDNLRHLLCLVQELSGETGMQPVELEYHGHRLAHNREDALAVIKGDMSEDAYVSLNSIGLPPESE